MNEETNHIRDLEQAQADEEILTYEVSDEALEAAADTFVRRTKGSHTASCGFGCCC